MYSENKTMERNGTKWSMRGYPLNHLQPRHQLNTSSPNTISSLYVLLRLKF